MLAGIAVRLATDACPAGLPAAASDAALPPDGSGVSLAAVQQDTPDASRASLPAVAATVGAAEWLLGSPWSDVGALAAESCGGRAAASRDDQRRRPEATAHGRRPRRQHLALPAGITPRRIVHQPAAAAHGLPT